MKNLFLVCCILNFSMTPLIAQNPTEGQVWVIINYIKATSKADYEKWMTDIFFAPMKTTQDPILKKQFSTARWQKPVRQNDDKTWTYSIILDPAIPSADYDIEHYLSKTYGEAKSKTYMQQYESFMASAGQIHFFESNRATETPSVKEDEEAIKKCLSDEGIAFSQGNINAFMDTYNPVPYLLWTVTNGMDPGDVLTFRGYDALKAFAQNLPWFKNFKPENSPKMTTDGTIRDNWNFQFRGNTAIVNFDEHWINDKEKSKVDLTVIKILEKINGQWKMMTTSALGDFKDATPPIRSKY